MPRPPQSGGAVFIPRSFAENRNKFGRSSSRLTADPIATPQQEAAEFQHALTNRIREHLLDKNTDLKTFCAAADLPIGLNYERFQRISRGETMLTLTDLLYWASEIPGLAGFIGDQIQGLVDAEHVDGRYTPGAPVPSGE